MLLARSVRHTTLVQAAEHTRIRAFENAIQLIGVAGYSHAHTIVNSLIGSTDWSAAGIFPSVSNAAFCVREAALHPASRSINRRTASRHDEPSCGRASRDVSIPICVPSCVWQRESSMIQKRIPSSHFLDVILIDYLHNLCFFHCNIFMSLSMYDIRTLLRALRGRDWRWHDITMSQPEIHSNQHDHDAISQSPSS